MNVADTRAPVRPPDPYADDVVARDPMWYAFATDVDRPEAPPWTWTDEPPLEEHVPPPSGVRTGARRSLPLGVWDRLDGVPFPAGRVDGGALESVLVAAFGVQWHDPAGRFGAHRGYASPRCRYPVHAFVDDGGRWSVLEPERHALAAPAGSVHRGRSKRVVLAGRYVELPSGYRWMRGTLVGLETGIALRALCVALELFGVTGRLRLPDAASAGLLADLGVTAAGEWSLPLAVELDAPADPVGSPVAAAPTGDASLDDLVRANREQVFAGPPAPLGPAVPPGAATGDGLSWAEVMWRRNSGRMPRGLRGFGARRHRLQSATVPDLLRWLCLPPPGPALVAAFDAVTVTVAVRDVDGWTDGVYRVEDGAARLHRADPAVMTRLEELYVHPVTPGTGCDVRHASMVWFLSVRPREVVAAMGPGGWTATQFACGWAVHGLCLAAAATGLFVRPVRAFVEAPTQRILDLDPDEMIVVAAVTGTPAHPAPDVLDIRL